MKKKTGQGYQIWKQFKRNKTAMIALVIILLFVLVAIAAPLFINYERDVVAQDLVNSFAKPSKEHMLGTDNYGRDIFSRIVYGGRMSLTIGIGTAAMALAVAIILGSVAGFYGGWVDTIISRICDAFICIPATLMALCIVAAMGSSLFNIMFAITVSQVPGFVRLIRSIVLTLREKDYVEAARSYGTSTIGIIFRHVLPNAIGPVIVQGTMAMADMMITAAGLGFLGMGISPPTPEWGTMLSEGREYIRIASHLVTFPGIAIVISALCFNLIGDGLRDALDPKQKR